MKRLLTGILLLLSLCACGEQTTPQNLSVQPPAVSVEDSTRESEVHEDSLVPSEATTSLPLEDCIIGIDPGHCLTPETGKGRRELVSPLSDQTKPLFGGGASGINMTEEQINLIVGLKLRDALVAQGAQVVMTREVSEITITGIERCDILNEAKVDVAIRIHADGSNDVSVHGVSVLIPSGDLLVTPAIVDKSAALGKLMVDTVALETGAKNRGTVKRTDLTGFNFSKVPTILIEMGFLSNAKEAARLESADYQDKIVSGIVDSLYAWYGIPPSSFAE